MALVSSFPELVEGPQEPPPEWKKVLLRISMLLIYTLVIIPPALATGMACSTLLYALKKVTTLRDGECQEQVDKPLAECDHVVNAHRWLLYLLGVSGVLTAALYKYVGNDNAAGGINTVLNGIQALDGEIGRRGRAGEPASDQQTSEQGEQDEQASRREFTGRGRAGEQASDQQTSEQGEQDEQDEQGEQDEQFTGLVSFRMAPLVWIGTVLTHFTGGSAGREGTALQMSAAIFWAYVDMLNKRRSVFSSDMKRAMIVASLASGFSGIFGVPVTGTIFSVEVLRVGTIELGSTLTPALVGAFVADWACRAMNKYIFNFEGHAHYPCKVCSQAFPQSRLEFIDFTELVAVVPAGIAFGLCARAFEFLLHHFKKAYDQVCKFCEEKGCPHSQRALVKPMLGGIVVILLWLLLCSAGSTSQFNIPAEYNGTEVNSYTFAEPYLGLGVDSPGESLSTCFTKGGVQWYSFLLKTAFVTLTLGAGFKGGEVTPLFFIGAALGNQLGFALGQDVELFAALGFVAVFAGAANTPLACTMMGVELFGGAKPLCFFTACFLAYLSSNIRKIGGIYDRQRPPNQERSSNDHLRSWLP